MATRFVTSRANGPSVDGTPSGAEQSLTGVRLPSTAADVVPILVDGVRGVAVAGDLGPGMTARLDAAVAEVCRTGRTTRDPVATPGFLLDLRDVTFLDAGGLFMLGRILEQIDGGGNELRVAAPCGAGPRRVLLLAVVRGLLPAVFSPWSN